MKARAFQWESRAGEGAQLLEEQGVHAAFLSPPLGRREVLARGPRMLEPAGSCSSRKVYKVYLLYLGAISLCQHYAGCQSAG